LPFCHLLAVLNDGSPGKSIGFVNNLGRGAHYILLTQAQSYILVLK